MEQQPFLNTDMLLYAYREAAIIATVELKENIYAQLSFEALEESAELRNVSKRLSACIENARSVLINVMAEDDVVSPLLVEKTMARWRRKGQVQ